MRKIVLAAAFAGFSTASFAAAPDAPVMEAPVVVERAAASPSATGVWLSLLLLTVAGVMVINN